MEMQTDEQIHYSRDHDQCVHYLDSRKQRDSEIERGEGLSATAGYEKAGCYDCNGKDKDCGRFLSINSYEKSKE